MRSKQFWLVGDDGVTLAGEWYGSASAPPVIMLHGGGQTRRSWRWAARSLAREGWCAVTVDLRGHGASGWAAPGHYDHSDFAMDLVRVAEQWDQPAIVGASMGGLAAILAIGELALDARALVLVDISIRPARKGARRIRNFMRGNPDGFASLEEAAAAVSAYLPHRDAPADPSGLEHNLRQRADGRWVWHWDPNFLGEHSRGQPESHERLARAAGRVAAPTLLVRGEHSDLLDPNATRAMLDLLPTADFVEVSGARHMVAGDDNDVFSSVIGEWLGRWR